MDASILAMSRRQAHEKATAVAWSAPDHDWTFGEVGQLTDRIAQGMQSLGIGRGDRVATLTKHQPESAMITMAAQKIGAVNMPVNWRLAGPEVQYILQDGEAAFMMSDAEFMPMLTALELPALRQTVLTRGDAAHGPHSTLAQWASGFAASDPGFSPDPMDAALQLYSSGTTGLPKGVELSHRALMAGFTGSLSQEWNYQPDVDVNLNALPAFHIAGHGVALMTYAMGGLSVTQPDFDPQAVLTAMVERRISHAFFVPAMIQFLLQVPGVDSRDFSALKMISYGASPISDRVLVDAMRVFGCGFLQVYGMTETAGAVTALRAEDHATEGPKAALLRSAGQEMAGVKMRVVRPGTDEDCDENEVGELLIRTDQNMTRYWRKDEATAQTLIPAPAGEAPWLRTGDAGYLRGGYLFLHDRIKDMIVSGGENIYPAEVENALMQHPDVADGAVIGVPDEKWGEAVKACVVLKPGSQADGAAIIAFMRERIAAFKCPKSVDFVDSIPRNPSGKILKRVLREPYWASQSRQIA